MVERLRESAVEVGHEVIEAAVGSPFDGHERDELVPVGVRGEPLVDAVVRCARNATNRLGRVIRPKATRAVLYEVITRKTGEVNTARRRRPD